MNFIAAARAQCSRRPLSTLIYLALLLALPLTLPACRVIQKPATAPVHTMNSPAHTPPPNTQTTPQDHDAINLLLNQFHNAASAADADRYFACFTNDAVFVGTDPAERWTLQQFRDYALPYFSQGRGWTYSPVSRHITLHAANDAPPDVAWFDELLRNDKYGPCRGSGVLTKTPEGWRIRHYVLSFAIPNDVALEATNLAPRP